MISTLTIGGCRLARQLYPRRPGLENYSGNLNFDTRNPGKATPAFDHYFLETTDQLHYYVRAIETVAPTTGVPRQYAGVNKKARRKDTGSTITDDTTFNDVVQGMVIGDNGSGVKIMLIGFGSSTNPRIAYRSLTTDTTPWTVQTTSTYAQFWLIDKAGADLYAVTDAGVAILGEYRISKCPAGNDPTLAASWGNGLEVGTPEWAITGIASIGDSIVVGKPDGLYAYNDQTKRFENVLPFLVDAPHAVNGKGMRAVPNGVLYPMHDGGLFFFDGVGVKDVSPDRGKVLPRDAGLARISALAPIGNEIYAIRESWQSTTQGLGLTVITRIAGTYTDVTADVTNGNLSNGANVGTFGNAADDCILVGLNEPMEGIVVRVTENVNAAVQSFATPEYSDGTTGTSAPFDSSFTAFSGSIVDNSILSVASTSLVNTGFPPGASNAVITWTDINAFDLMTSTEIQFGGSIGTLTKYWIRLKRVSATGMTAGTRIDELEAIPSRAGLPITAANDFTHRWRAGGLTEVLVARITGTTAYDWHSVYHVHTLGGNWAAAWHSGRAGQASGAQNLGPQLVIWGRHKATVISESQTRDTTRTLGPRIAQYGSSKPGPLLNLTPGGEDFGDVTKEKSLKGIAVDGRYAQPTDKIHVYCQFDDHDAIKIGTAYGLPAYVSYASGRFRRLNVWLGYEDAANGDKSAPQILYAEADYTEHGQYEWPRDRATQTPEAT